MEITKENEFDRLLLLHIDQFLIERKIPVLFLKSNYFTLRSQLLQVYQDEQSGFRGRIEQINHHLQQQIWSDYSTLINETNRIYISRYPFEDGVRMVGITAHTPHYTAFRTKLRTITQLCLTIQGSTNKFRGLDEHAFQHITETSSRSPRKLWVDEGKEFYNSIMKKWLVDMDIHMYSTHNEGKAVVVKRFHRTMKSRMWRHFTASSTNVYINVLPQLLEDYNNAKHRSIGMTPTEASDPENGRFIQQKSTS